MMKFERYFYDTEFFEDGPQEPIQLISIGIKAHTVGRRYYAVSNEFDLHRAWYKKSQGHYWLRDHVIKQLPLMRRADGSIWLDGQGAPALDASHSSVKSLPEIRDELEEFFELQTSMRRELWAWYADYDHVVLSQIWGAMIKLPEGMPMFTHDLKQVVNLGGNPLMPVQMEGLHNALNDAEHVEIMWEHCNSLGLPVAHKV